jgi:hypothetical protein
MFQQGKNTLAMQLAWFAVLFWLLMLYPASSAETGILRWHQHTHWLDKVAGYAFWAVEPALVGFIVGVAFGGRKVLRNCKDCGGKFDVEAMLWGFDDPIGQVGSWRCQRCCAKPSTEAGSGR